MKKADLPRKHPWPYQGSLFEHKTGSRERDAALMRALKELRKVDLHRHLTGSIDADLAVSIATKYGVGLPTYIASELSDQLFGDRAIRSLEEYFVPWEVLNALFVNAKATTEIVATVAQKAAADNVAYVELRTSPRGFLGDNDFRFDGFLEAIAAGVDEAETASGIVVRLILGIPRHVFGPIPPDVRTRMLKKIVSMIEPLRGRYFVGIDLNGVEDDSQPDGFDEGFAFAYSRGLKVTVHAGECGPSRNVRQAVEQLKASRIGHGIAAAADVQLMGMLGRQHCTLEICPTSNVLLGVVRDVKELPVDAFRRHAVPFVFCTDNPARCRTTQSEELFKIAKAFNLTLAEIVAINVSAIDCSFADERTKADLRERVG